MYHISKPIGTGSYLPNKVRSNKDIEDLGIKLRDGSLLNAEAILRRCGILERRVSSGEETVEFMAAEASKKALEKAELKSKDITSIYLSSVTSRDMISNSASRVHYLLGLERTVPTFQIPGACCGFIQALLLADREVREQGGYSLVIASDVMSNRTREDPLRMLFGDGAGALVLAPNTARYGLDAKKGIQGFVHYTDSENAELISQGPDGLVNMDEGGKVLKEAVRSMSSGVFELCNNLGWKIDNVKILPHQANSRIVNGVGEKIGASQDKVYSSGVIYHGNMSGATVAVGYDLCCRGKTDLNIEEGDKAIIATFGAGTLTYLVGIQH